MRQVSELVERTRHISEKAIDKFSNYQITPEDVKGLLAAVIEGAKRTENPLNFELRDLLEDPLVVVSLQEVMQKFLGTYREYYYEQQFDLIKEIAKLSKDDYLKYANEAETISIETAIKTNLMAEAMMVRAFEESKEDLIAMVDAFRDQQTEGN